MAVPAAVQLTAPLAVPTEMAEGKLLVQVPPGTESDKNSVLPGQRGTIPEIGAGAASTISVLVMVHETPVVTV